jgi:S-adenosylmethionine:tRNA ribosyltransferase-isomerase
MLDITLHVGLGTFKPYDADNPEDFSMHTEKILIPREVIEHCKDFFLNPDRGLFTCVGTTSCRTMESVFWFGVQLLNPDSSMWNQSYISMQQWTPYSLRDVNINPADVFAILLIWMDRYNLSIIEGETQLMIIPGYSFGLTEALITNFHQPKSTLLFLVSAFLGVDVWKQSYEYALKNEYRFLRYGDSSLLIKGKIHHADPKPVL